MATRWLEEAKKYIGIKEVEGSGSDPQIAEWFERMGFGGQDDSVVPWCAIYVNCMLENVGIQGTASAASQSFIEWGEEGEAEPGSIVVFRGHVAIVSAVEPELMIIGGNQSDGVKDQPARYYGEPLAFRWPTEELPNTIDPDRDIEQEGMDELINDPPSLEDLPPSLSAEEARDMALEVKKEILDAQKWQYSEIMDRLESIMSKVDSIRDTKGIVRPGNRKGKLT